VTKEEAKTESKEQELRFKLTRIIKQKRIGEVCILQTPNKNNFCTISKETACLIISIPSASTFSLSSLYLRLSLLLVPIHFTPTPGIPCPTLPTNTAAALQLFWMARPQRVTSSDDVTALYRLQHPALRLLATPSHTHDATLPLTVVVKERWKRVTNGATTGRHV
jgi:hypothetical protein